MKSACVFLLALSGVSAFAPAQTARPATTQLAATEELASIRGANSPETGGKTVRSVFCATAAIYCYRRRNPCPV